MVKKSSQIKTIKITATFTRNNFFGLVQDAYLNNSQYLIEKNGIPMAYITSPKNFSTYDEQTEKVEKTKTT